MAVFAEFGLDVGSPAAILLQSFFKEEMEHQCLQQLFKGALFISESPPDLIQPPTPERFQALSVTAQQRAADNAVRAICP